jgi:deoxyribonuclease V
MNLFEYAYDLVRQIPPHRLSTYGAIAQALGDHRAARAVGRMMNQNPDANTMPCFKIIYSDGSLGGFGLGIGDKIRRITNDGIQIKDGKIQNFENIFFNEFNTGYPLKKLQNEQKTIKKQVKIKDDIRKPIHTIGGIDVAYPKSEFENACAAYVAVDYITLEITETRLAYATTKFPYIPGYLTYREYPVIKEVLKKIKTIPSVLFIDGNGLLHPRKCGIACHIGVKHNLPTIGIAKRKLVGENQNDHIMIDDEIVASTLISGRARTPIYISPGNRISVDTSFKITKKLSRYKNPEPLRLAHRFAQQGLRK